MSRAVSRSSLSALAAAVLTTTLVSCGSDASEIGDSARATAEIEADGTAVSLHVPVGTITVSVGSPREEAPEAQTAGGETLQAPDGASVVLATVGYTPGTGADSAGLLPGTTPLPTDLALSSGDREVELGAPYTIAAGAPQADPHSEWVVVPGDGSDLALEVTFDGLTQSVDLGSGEQDLGVAAAYADLGGAPLTEEAACPVDWAAPDAPEVTGEVDCSLSTSAGLPWAPGVGWAEDDAGWRLVLADVAVTAVTGATAPQSGAGLALSASLDGAEPADAVVTTPSSTAPGAAAVRWVFASTPDAAGSLDLEVGYATDDTARRVTLATTTPLAGQ